MWNSASNTTENRDVVIQIKRTNKLHPKIVLFQSNDKSKFLIKLTHRPHFGNDYVFSMVGTALNYTEQEQIRQSIEDEGREKQQANKRKQKQQNKSEVQQILDNSYRPNRTRRLRAGNNRNRTRTTNTSRNYSTVGHTYAARVKMNDPGNYGFVPQSQKSVFDINNYAEDDDADDDDDDDY